MPLIKEKFALTVELDSWIKELFKDQDDQSKWFSNPFTNHTDKPQIFYTRKNCKDLDQIKRLIKNGYLMEIQRTATNTQGTLRKVPNHWQLPRTDKYFAESQKLNK